jgi:hypothetical protein
MKIQIMFLLLNLETQKVLRKNTEKLGNLVPLNISNYLLILA